MSNVKPTYISPIDGLPKPVDTSADTLAAKAVYVQTSATPDTAVGVSRDGSSNLVLTDSVVGSKTLYQLVNDPLAGQKKPAVARYDYPGLPPPTFPAQASPATYTGIEHFVGSSPGDFPLVSAAIAAAAPYDIITVRSGYNSAEVATVVVSKPLEIRGQNRVSSEITGTVLGPLLSIPQGTVDVYVHDLTVRNNQSVAGDPNTATNNIGAASCITANTMGGASLYGSTGLRFEELTVVHPRTGIVVSGDGFVIEACSFACTAVSPTLTIHPIVNYGQHGNCYISGCSIASAGTTTTCIYVSSVIPNSGTYAPGHDGNLVLQNITQTGACSAYVLADTLHQPGNTSGGVSDRVHALPAAPGSLSLYLDNCQFAGAWTDESIGLRDNTVSLNNPGGGVTLQINTNTTTVVAAVALSGSPSTVRVNSVAGFPMSGTFRVRTSTGVATVTYGNRVTGGPQGPRFLNCTVASPVSLAVGDNVWSTDTFNFFSRVLVNNCSGAARSSGDQKGFIAFDPTGGTQRVLGAPSTDVWVYGTNTFSSTPAGAYASIATTPSGYASVFGYATARYSTTSTLTITYPIYVPSGTLTVDENVELSVGDRVMLVNTYDGTYSGLYNVVSPGQWTRCVDMPVGVDAAGYYWFVLYGGTVYGSTWHIVDKAPGQGVVGTSQLAFARIPVATALNTVSGASAIVGGGTSNEATALHSSVLGGSTNKASSNYASALGGSSNTASGNYSVAGGQGNQANSQALVALGSHSYHFGDATPSAWVAADPLFALGNSLFPASRSNAVLVLKNAYTGIGLGQEKPEEMLHVAGNVLFTGALMPAGEAGDEGMVLTSHGSDLPPTWEAAGGGGVTLQSAYDNSGSPATITLANGKNLVVAPDVGANANIDLTGSAVYLNSVDGGSINIGNNDVADPIRIGETGDRTISIGKASGATALAFYPATLSINGSEGDAGQVLTSGGLGNPPTWQTPSGGGGLTYWAESENVAFPNTSIPVNALAVVSAGADADAAIVPKGVGALLAAIPNGGVLGGDKRGNYAVDLQMERDASTQVASGSCAVVSGGKKNRASGDYATVTGGFANVASGEGAMAGGFTNTATANYATVSGGSTNNATNTQSVVSGGYNNTASGTCSAIGGGDTNEASGGSSFVGGGYGNHATASFTVIGGGFQSFAQADYGTIGGGSANYATGQYSTVSGGRSNTASGDYATVTGGWSNSASGDYGSVGGGFGNNNTGLKSAIANGNFNAINGGYGFAFIGAGTSNIVAANESAICAGTSNNVINADSFVGAGANNLVTGAYASVVSGTNNTANGSYAHIGSGQYVQTNGSWTVANGGYNVQANSDYSTVGGGYNVQTNATYATAAGGFANRANGYASAVGGGINNNADARGGTIPGGDGASTRGVVGRYAFASLSSNGTGGQQTGQHVTRVQTTGATLTTLSVLGLNLNTGTINTLPNNSAYAIHCIVVARSSTGVNASWEVRGCVQRGANAASTALVGTPPAPTSLGADAGASGWTVALAANTTYGAAVVNVTGAASTTIDWVCTMFTTEIAL